MFGEHVTFTLQVKKMQLTVLQFATLAELASYTKKVTNKGFQINTLNLTLKIKLSEEEILFARKQFRARMVEQLRA